MMLLNLITNNKYSRGLRSPNIPRISKGKYREYQVLVSNLKPRITKTANTKTADNEGRLYWLKNGPIRPQLQALILLV